MESFYHLTRVVLKNTHIKNLDPEFQVLAIGGIHLQCCRNASEQLRLMIIALPDVNVDSHRGIVPTYGLCISHMD